MNKSHETVIIESDLAPIVPGFIENRKSDLEILKKAIDRKDFPAIASVAHKIKGSSGGYGFHALSQIGATLEKISKEHEEEQTRALINSIDIYLQTVKIIYRKPA